jgi:hypothetical protein
MEAACLSETSVSYHITTWHHNSADHDMNLHRREKLKSRIFRLGSSVFCQSISKEILSSVCLFSKNAHLGLICTYECCAFKGVSQKLNK